LSGGGQKKEIIFSLLTMMVTHEQEIAAQAQRIVTMRDGQIIGDQRKNKDQTLHEKFNANDHSRLIKNILDQNEKKTKKTSWDVYVKQAWHSLWVKKVRAVLSMLGILIGVAAVIAMLALGTGATKSIEQELSALGTNLLIIRPGSLSNAGISFGVGGTSRFSVSDVKALKQLNSIQDISGQVSGRAQAVFQNKNWNTSVQGVDPEYLQIHRLTLEQGRFFNESESVARERVVVIGKTIVKELFGIDTAAQNVIGRQVKINRINFKVIGILPEKGFSRGRDQDDILYVPIPTAMYRLFGKIYVDSIEAQIVSEDQISPAKKEIQQILSARHRLDPENEKSVDIRDMSEIQNAVKSTTATISILLGSVAAIALVVGGIGIMNIMLVSVTERTREIGLRKAIGATKRDIMNQFLVEAIVMTLTGGFLGIVLGFGISKLISLLAGWATVVSLFSIFLSSGFSIAVGLIFGIWPAQQAANLKTIEALRYE
jgi:macrolide transport system ATP-binding/permease protein